MKPASAADPRVRAFLDALAAAVAASVIRDVRSGALAIPTRKQVRRVPGQGERGALGAIDDAENIPDPE